MLTSGYVTSHTVRLVVINLLHESTQTILLYFYSAYYALTDDGETGNTQNKQCQLLFDKSLFWNNTVSLSRYSLLTSRNVFIFFYTK